MDPDKLAKVLAMAESEHQGEAQSALRAARIMLSRAGMTFRDLANGARPIPSKVEPARNPVPPPPPDHPPPPDQLVQGLRRQVGDMEREIAALRRALDKANGDADRQREEAERWRSLARETAEKLWDLGKALERRHSRSTIAERRRAIIDLLQDPGSALLSDSEIARRVGTAPHMVAHWRRRLAIVGRKIRLLPVQPRGRGLWGARLLKRFSPDVNGSPVGTTAGQSNPAEQRHRWLGSAPVTIAAGRGQSWRR